MIDKLKFLIDNCEDKPKLKEILLKIAAMPEKDQEKSLNIIERLIEVMK